MPVVLHLRYNRVNCLYSPILDLQSTAGCSQYIFLTLVELVKYIRFCTKTYFLTDNPYETLSSDFPSLCKLQKVSADLLNTVKAE